MAAHVVEDAYLLELILERDRIPSFESYPFHLAAVRHLDRLPLHRAVTFLVGENGSGKSTLLEAIAVAGGFNAEGGSRSFQFDTRASHSSLHEYVRLARGVRRPRDGWFLRAESYFNVATHIEQLDEEDLPAARIGPAYGKRALHEQSHGESFLALMMNRFFGRGVYLLDEPEAALSPTRQMTVLSRMHQLIGADSQFVIATHSPILMAYPNATIYHLDDDGIRPIAYEETEHFHVTKSFLEDHERMLDILLED